MAEGDSTFHESWYRVANLRITLRTHLRFHRQFMRGERWHVVEDPLNNQFFRLRPAAWRFIARLDGQTSVEEAWKASLESDPESAPGQTEVIHILSQLYGSNLITSNVPADTENLFKRYSKRVKRELTSRLASFMFARFPLVDPDRFLVKCLPAVNLLLNKLGALLWIVVFLLGIKTVVENRQFLWAEGGQVLSPDNLGLLYLGVVLLSILHEFGHAFTCRKYGGEVHTMGIMLLVFTPLPYVDVTSSWAARSQWQRMLVGAAGMITELFIASIAAMVWAGTGPGVIHGLAFNVMFAASVSTILFNANPLLRFDGYYLLADWLELPNLYSRAQQEMKYLFERYLFAIPKVKSVAANRREETILIVYGIASLIYRIIVFTSIILFVSSQLLLLGLLLGFFCFIAWVLIPTGKFIHFLAVSPRLHRTRKRSVLGTVGLIAIPVILLYFVPAPSSFRAPGVVRADNFQAVAARSGGHLAEIFASSGQPVKTGDPLLRLEDEELLFLRKTALAQLKEVEAKRTLAMEKGGADLEAIERLEESVRERLHFIDSQIESQIVRAPFHGIWVASTMQDDIGRWYQRGEPVGVVVDEDKLLISAIISQDFAGLLFADKVKYAQVRIRGQSDSTLPVSEWQAVQAERRELPSASLSWQAGGAIETEKEDPEARYADRAFFEVRAVMDLENQPVKIYQGQRGLIRFRLKNEPYLQQWIRKLRQLWQKTYGPDNYNRGRKPQRR